jgi:hypothetical protein
LSIAFLILSKFAPFVLRSFTFNKISSFVKPARSPGNLDSTCDIIGYSYSGSPVISKPNDDTDESSIFVFK